MHESENTARLGAERTRKNPKKLDHLTRDVLAAEKAGQSYGQWKAAHPYTGEEDDEPAPLVPRPGKKLATCAQCGGKFEVGQGQSNKLYCSVKCQTKRNSIIAAEKKHKDEAEKTKPCVICGAPFLARNSNSRYCSTRCADEGRKRRVNARRAEKLQSHGPKVCPVCGQLLPLKWVKFRTYCSDKCRETAYRARKKENKEDRHTNA